MSSETSAQEQASDLESSPTLVVREERSAAGGGGGPYPGLRPFEAREETLFFGREEHVDALLTRLQRNRFLAVVGSSGCGKSSLVRAGLIPNLEANALYTAGSRWRVVTMRPGDRPLTRLAEGLYDEGFGNGPDITSLSPEEQVHEDEKSEMRRSAVRQMRAGFRLGGDSLIDFLRTHQKSRSVSEGENLLLLVDQFEEIFRFRDGGRDVDRVADRREAEEFVALLLRTARESRERADKADDPRVYVVLTMRSDYLGECQVFDGLPEMLNDAQFLTPRLTSRQMRDAIVGPARIFGAEIELALVSRILDHAARVLPESDQLPLLQHALMRLWTYQAARREQKGQTAGKVLLTLEDYKAIGDNLGNVLDQHATEVRKSAVESIAASPSSADRKKEVEDLLAFLFRQITGRVAGRAARTPTEVGMLLDMALAGVAAGRDRAMVHSELAAIYTEFSASGRNFLTSPRFDPSDERSRIDITHEALFRQWKQLDRWMAEEVSAREWYDRLERDAAVRVTRNAETFWPGATLEAAQSAWTDAGLPTEPNQQWAQRQAYIQGQEQNSPQPSEEARNNSYRGAIKFLAESRADEEGRIAKEQRRLRDESATEYEKFTVAAQRRANRLAGIAILVTFLFAAVASGIAIMKAAKKINEASAIEKHANQAEKRAKDADTRAGEADKRTKEAKLAASTAHTQQVQAENKAGDAQKQLDAKLKSLKTAQAELSTSHANLLAAKKAIKTAGNRAKEAEEKSKSLLISVKDGNRKIQQMHAQTEKARQDAEKAQQVSEQLNQSLTFQVQALSQVKPESLKKVIVSLAEGDVYYAKAPPELTKAREAYLRAEKAYQEGGSPLGVGLTLLKLALLYDKVSDTNEARKDREAALRKFKDLPQGISDALDKIEVLKLIANVDFQINDRNDQINTLLSIADIYSNIPGKQNQLLQIDTLQSIVTIYRELKNKDRQIETLKRIAELYGNIPDKKNQAQTLRSIAGLYGDDDKKNRDLYLGKASDADKAGAQKSTPNVSNVTSDTNKGKATANSSGTSKVDGQKDIIPAEDPNQKKKPDPPPNVPLTPLEAAINKYNSGNVDDQLATDLVNLKKQFKSTKQTADHQKAAFYLGRLYHHKFEISLSKKATKEADGYYTKAKGFYVDAQDDYHEVNADKTKLQAVHAFADFYKAILCMEHRDLGELTTYINRVNKDTKKNSNDTVFIDYISWPEKGGPINRSFKATDLSVQFGLIRDQFKGGSVIQTDIDQIIVQLTDWCRSQP